MASGTISNDIGKYVKLRIKSTQTANILLAGLAYVPLEIYEGDSSFITRLDDYTWALDSGSYMVYTKIHGVINTNSSISSQIDGYSEINSLVNGGASPTQFMITNSAPLKTTVAKSIRLGAVGQSANDYIYGYQTAPDTYLIIMKIK